MKKDKTKPQTTLPATRPESKERPRSNRLREVEELMINGMQSGEIAERIMPRHNVCKGTVYNDISAVYKRWGGAVETVGVVDGRERYLASLESLRRKALTGWNEQTDKGIRIRGRDFKLVHELDKEIARFSGLDLKSDSKTVHLTVEKARGYLDKIMTVIFRHVKDEKTQNAILEDFAGLDESS